MAKNICNGKKTGDGTENAFIDYSKSLVKTFVLLMVVILFFSLKNMLVSGTATMFTSALFVLGATLLFSIINVTDKYIYNNVILGVGIALGLSFSGLGGMSFDTSSGGIPIGAGAKVTSMAV